MYFWVSQEQLSSVNPASSPWPKRRLSFRDCDVCFCILLTETKTSVLALLLYLLRLPSCRKHVHWDSKAGQLLGVMDFGTSEDCYKWCDVGLCSSENLREIVLREQVFVLSRINDVRNVYLISSSLYKSVSTVWNLSATTTSSALERVADMQNNT